MKHTRFCFYICAFLLLAAFKLSGQTYPRFKVLAFYSNTVEKAHIDFSDAAIQFFNELTVGNGFVFDTTSTQNKLIISAFRWVITSDKNGNVIDH